MAKLTRVAMLPVLVLLVAWSIARRAKQAEDMARGAMPWFVLGFVALMILGNVLPIWPALKAQANNLAIFLLSMGLAAMGMATDLSKIRAKGLRPLLLAGAATLFISTLSLGLILWLA